VAEGRRAKRPGVRADDGRGGALPLQTWPLAYWPDGSLKWSGFATSVTGGATGGFTLSPSQAASPLTAPLKVTESGEAVQIDTGPLQCVIAKSGANLVERMAVNGVVVAQAGQLECILQDGPENNPRTRRSARNS